MSTRGSQQQLTYKEVVKINQYKVCTYLGLKVSQEGTFDTAEVKKTHTHTQTDCNGKILA